MTPEDILADFNNTQNQFAPIDHQPTDDDLVRLEETLYPLPSLTIAKVENTTSSASSSTTNHTKKYTAPRSPFPVPTKPGAYDTSIPDDAKAVLRARSEVIHKARINDYLLYDAALRATHKFILGVIDDTYVG